jgi:hypothetical protein
MVTLPDATGVTAPTPLLILTDVAFVVVHDKVADEPLVMLVGLTVRVTVGVGGGFEVEPPPPPLPQPARAAMTILIATTFTVFMTALSYFEVFMTIDSLSLYDGISARSSRLFKIDHFKAVPIAISKLRPIQRLPIAVYPPSGSP